MDATLSRKLRGVFLRRTPLYVQLTRPNDGRNEMLAEEWVRWELTIWLFGRQYVVSRVQQFGD